MPRFAEFCAGIGGFRIGLERIDGWECVYTNEIDERCQITYRDNFNEDFSSTDIFEIDVSQLPDFDVLCAGFPCQSFSIAGKREGFEDPRGQVFFKLEEIIENKNPSVIFLENVANLVRHNRGETFGYIKKSLKRLGYKVSHNILDSSYFGVPQKRPRVYIVAFRYDINSNEFEITERVTNRTTFREFINHGDNSIPISDKWQTYIDLYTGNIDIEDVDFEVPKTRKKLERIGSNVDLNDCIFQIRSSGIRAVSIDEPLPTFAVSNSGGGAMIPVYSRERRHLNLTEMKRIMGFPDEFIFTVARTHAIKQLANAVCPPVITSIGRDIDIILNNQE
ncbi:DNA (cytosine-5-)-methyltransferase [Romboutsia ilealis]|uniref:Cytosine-specific methyltransferase n=1 Tax=Romboutsia faecis TaxID=2764597 RepID=A0ABR7JTB5_9FIRM|nr:DNA (cytosine-5-)-methyltransferase [Romboutsia faecis]MBC5998158.1 DNA (cytosine-5-)-methyltransferase [Romboutsia faecis]MRN25778.1 DNA (cytosine-5-)-methyltransferase [Romboutsia ilealis]